MAMQLSDHLSEPALSALYTGSALLAVFLLRLLLLAALVREKQSLSTQASIKTNVTVFCLTIFLIAAVLIWFQGFRPVFAFLGIVSVGIIIVMKEVLLNLLASGIIFWRELFAVGDRIEITELRGDVVSKGLFYFTMLQSLSPDSGEQSSGKIIKVPNALVLTSPIINATKGFDAIWNEVSVTITPDSDWEKARSILNTIANDYEQSQGMDYNKVLEEMQKEYIHFAKLTPFVYVRLSGKGIVLTARYLCRARERRNSEQFLFERILREFLSHDSISLAFE